MNNPEQSTDSERYSHETIQLLCDIDGKVFDFDQYEVSETTEDEVDAHLRERGVGHMATARLEVENDEVTVERRFMDDGSLNLYLGGGGHSASLVNYDQRFEGRKVYWGVELSLDYGRVKRATAVLPRHEDEPEHEILSNDNLRNIGFRIQEKIVLDRR